MTEDGIERRKTPDRRADADISEIVSLRIAEIISLRKETRDLANEVHKLRGTLQAFVPRKEMNRALRAEEERLVERVTDLERSVNKRMGRRTVTYWGSLFAIVLMLGWAFTVQQDLGRQHVEVNEATATAIERSCEDRKMNLRALIELAAEGAPDLVAAAERNAPLLALIDGQDCADLTRDLRTEVKGS